MRDYAKIAPTFWTRGSGRRLRDDQNARLTALYLMSAPVSNMVGLYYLPVGTVASDLGVTQDEARRCISKCVEVEICAYDFDAEVVWVPNMASRQVDGDLEIGDNRRKWVTKTLIEVRDTIGSHCFFELFFQKYRSRFSLDSKEFHKEFHKCSTPSEGGPEGGTQGGPEASDQGSGIREEEKEKREPRSSGARDSELELDTKPAPPSPLTARPTLLSLEGPTANDSGLPATPDAPDLQNARQSPPAAQVGLFPIHFVADPIDAVAELWKLWVENWRRHVGGNRPPKLDDKRRRLAKARLKDFSPDDLKQAIDGLWSSDWHRENGYTKWELCFRDTAHVEDYMARFVPEAAESSARFREPVAPEDPNVPSEVQDELNDIADVLEVAGRSRVING